VDDYAVDYAEMRVWFLPKNPASRTPFLCAKIGASKPPSHKIEGLKEKFTAEPNHAETQLLVANRTTNTQTQTSPEKM